MGLKSGLRIADLSKVMRLSAHILLLTLIGPAAGHAQLDSSSAVLLRPSGRALAPEDLDSSLYTIRAPESKKEDVTEDREDKPASPVANTKPARAKNEASPKTGPAPSPAPSLAASSSPAPAPAPPTAMPAPSTEADRKTQPAVTEQMRELIWGGSREDIDEYRRQIHPEDSRANVLDISFAPAYYYEGSDSPYSFRRYTSNGPGFGLGMHLWFTPFFGLQSNYFSSVTGSVSDGAGASVPLDLQVLEAGVRFRRHFGFSRKAPQLIWGIDYHETSERIGRDSTIHVGHKSSGFSLGVETKLPVSITYAHTFEIKIQPRLHHSERASGVMAKSGENNQANAISLGAGGDWSLDRHNLLYWKAVLRTERAFFQGQASLPDTQTGNVPSSVSVTDNLLIFYFGFKWGS